MTITKKIMMHRFITIVSCETGSYKMGL